MGESKNKPFHIPVPFERALEILTAADPKKLPPSARPGQSTHKKMAAPKKKARKK